MAVFAQRKTEVHELFIESLLENLDTDIDLGDIVDHWLFVLDHPLNLNKINASDLLSLQLLTPAQANEVIQYREKIGKYISIYELQQTFIELDVLKKLSHFLFVSQNIESKAMRKLNSPKHILVFNWERSSPLVKEFTIPDSLKSAYKGSPNRLIVRYRGNKGNIAQWGLTAEKDAGEVFSIKEKGFDYYSGHLFLSNIGPFTSIALGDYQIHFGQGLTLGSGFSIGKSALVMSVKRNFKTLRPYRSLNENEFMRGIAFQTKYKKLSFTSFFSRLQLDANILERTDTISEFSTTLSASSIQQTGLHRTAGEINDKDALLRTQYGGRLSYDTRKISLGANFVHTMFSHSLFPKERLYNSFYFTGNAYQKMGVDYEYRFSNTVIFGEYSFGSNGGMALINGALISLSPQLDLSFYHRVFSKDFIYYQSNALSESSNNVNEKGFYSGLELKLNKDFRLNGYIDLFRFDWAQFRSISPSEGFDALAEVHYKPSKKLHAYLRLKVEEKIQSISLESPEKEQVVQKLIRSRANLTLKPSKSIKTQTRIVLNSWTNGTGQKFYGSLLFQDIKWKPKVKPYSLAFRLAYYYTEKYQNSIYAYENDVLYTFSVPAYRGKGYRTYLLLKYRHNRNLEFRTKIAYTYRQNEIESNYLYKELNIPNKLDFKLQLRLLL